MSTAVRWRGATRQGENLADKFLIGRLGHLFLSLDLYQSVFEPAFLLDSKRFFRDEGLLLVNSVDTAMFLAAVDRRYTGPFAEGVSGSDD